MLVLHAAWTPPDPGDASRLLLWGEELADRTPPGPSERRGSHPFAVAPSTLRRRLGELGLEAPLTPGGAVLLLPTVAAASRDDDRERVTWRGAATRGGSVSLVACAEEALRPLPGVEMDEGPAGTLELAPWRVAGLVTPLPAALVWLARLGGATSGLVLGGDGPIAFGADLRFWAAAGRWALELLARGRVVPTVGRRTDGDMQAVWRPALAGHDERRRLRALAEAMPPACRAWTPSGAAEASPPPQELLLGFLEAAVDGVARGWLSEAAWPEGRWMVRQEMPPGAGRWLEALVARPAAARLSARRSAGLGGEVAAWTGPALGARGAPFRLRLGLSAPEEEGEPWRLGYLLQATDDPAVLVPAAVVWRIAGAVARVVGRRVEEPQELLLAELGRAALLFAPITASLEEAQPIGVDLTTEAAYAFLREAAPALEEAGLSVQVPSWWTRRGARRRLGVRLRLRPSRRPAADGGAGALGVDALVEYDWRLALGDEEISREEFERLAAQKAPLVRLRGEWIELRPEDVDQTLRFWRGRSSQGELATAQALRLGLGGEATGLPLVDVGADGWIAEMLAARPDGLGDLAEPAGFVGELRPYQRRGLAWLAFMRSHGLGACLADDMGLGKTIQTIALLLHARQAATRSPHPHPLPEGEGKAGVALPEGEGKAGVALPEGEGEVGVALLEGEGAARRPTLLVCPTSVLGNWVRELQRFGPGLRVLVHHGPERPDEARFAEAAAGYDVVLTTYGLAHRDEARLAAVSWAGVVLDEAQNVKNPGARASRAVRRLPAGFHLALTGTPVENRLGELWSIMEFLNPGFLGSTEMFRRRFAMPIEREGDAERAEELRRLVGPFVLRRLKSDPTIVRDLPEKLEMKVYTTLTREQASLYEAVVQDMLAKIADAEGTERRGLILATLTKLKQVCNHPAHFLGDGSGLAHRSGKLARLEEMLEELLEAGDQALVFTQFAEFGGRLRTYLQGRLGREVLYLYGGTPAEERDRLVARFQRPDGPPVFVLSLRAGGVGLNLTRANHVFHYDRWWNPAVETQATDRAHRIGQTRTVQVHTFVAAGTLEERIDELIESKRALADAVIGTGESWLTELSTEDLRSILTLRQAVIADA